MNRRLLPMGDRAVLVECGDDQDSPAGLAAAIRAAAVTGVVDAGVVDLVPGEATVLVTVAGPDRLPVLRSLLVDLVDSVDLPARVPAAGSDVVVLPVTYDGPDLEAVARTADLDRDEVVERHRHGTYHVAFCGFAPGFAYLRGLDPRLHLPRRPEPRTRVPAGSLAVAGRYTAVYPTATPGGWHLIGTCRQPLWDPTADPPGLLAPGTVVRFEPE